MPPSHRLFSVLGAAALGVMACTAPAQSIPSFPGAEGAGAAALGGRGGDVYYVTSLADTNTAGTLRYGISSAPASGRTILFKTGGTIYLQSNLDVNKPKITIAGQSAPGGGITMAYRQTQVSNVSDVVIRNLRFRPGNSVTLASGTASPYEPDALHVEGVNRVMIDHVSASWSVDEVLSVTNSTNTTVQWSSITEALRNAGHSKGSHGYGALISGDVISYHHNYLAHNDSRNPRPGLSVSGNYVTGTINFDYRNNVNYNWGNENGYNGSEAGVMNMNYVGNYSVAGPSTTSSKTGRAFLVGLTDTRLYLAGNKIDSNRDLVLNGTDTGWSMIATSTSTNPTRPAAPVGNTTFVSTQTADAAYASVMAHAGATYWARDAVDVRVFSHPATQGGTIIDSGTQVGGYPTLASGTAPTDTDGDGMPDAWETALGLNPAVANNNADFDNDGYTDLEEYLNELAAWPAPLPAVFATGSSARFALWSNWDTKWQPSRFDTAQITSGTAVVDAIGQDAGTVQIGGTAAGPVPTLSIASGGLRVTNNLVVGSSTTAAVLNLSGGALTVGGTVTTGSATGAVMTMTGGTLTAVTMMLGPGTSSLGGGTLRTGLVQAGGSGTAARTFTWTGGTIQNRDAATDLVVSSSSGLTLAVSGTGAKTLAVDDGRTLTLAARLTGTAGVSKTGGGTLVVSGSSTGFTGGFTLAGGTTVVGNNAALGSAGAVTLQPLVSSSMVLQLGPAVSRIANPLVLGNNTSVAVVAGTNGVVFSGGMQLAGGNRTLQNALGGRTLEFSGTTVLGLSGTSVPRILTVSGSGTTLFSGPIVNGGTTGGPGLVINTTGTTILAAANTFSGTTTVARGTLRLAHPQAAGATLVSPITGGTVVLGAGLQATVGGLRTTGGGVVDVGSGLLTVASGLTANDLVAALGLGLGDGSWNGTSGIRSSAAAASGGDRTVGWLDNGDGSLTVGFAAAGDTNLDWQVDILDASNFLAGGRFDSGLPANWNQGDFTADGLVDILDGANFLSAGLFDAGAYAGGAGQAAASGPVAVVPEPASLTLLLAGLFGCLLLLGPGAAASPRAPADDEPLAEITAPFPMPQLQRPVFADRVVSIADHGAVAGGTVKNTAAIKAAVAAAAAAGGGRVLVPEGVWLTGPVHLTSGIELHLAAGAVLTFSDEFTDYLPPVFVRSGGIELWNYSPLIYARDATNVAITGPGRLDGNARAWWPWKTKESRRGFEAGAAGTPVAERVFGTPEAAIRPSFVGLVSCTNVLLEGFTIGSGPNWTIHPIYCENVIVRRVTVATDGPNNDGIDPDSCRNVLIEHCVFDTGDDCVVLKSGYDQDGRRVGRPTENVVMRHCSAKRGHGGLVIGSEMSGSVRNVYMHDCDFEGTDRVLRIKSRPGRGGVVERVWVENVTARGMKREVVILNMDYSSDKNPVTHLHPPRFRDIHVRGVAAVGAPVAIRIVGMESSPIERVSFADLAVVAEAGVVATHAAGLAFDRVAITPTKGPLWDLEAVSGLTRDGAAVGTEELDGGTRPRAPRP